MAVKTSAGGFRVGFVGAGGISSAHATMLKLLPDVKLAAVCDTTASRAEELARDFAIPEIYSSASEMVQKGRLDAVHILTPPQYHIEPALECLRAGCHVLVEKPLGLSAADCERVVAESARTGLVCAVNHSLTHGQIIDRLIGEIRSRRLGRVNHVLMNFCAPPGYVPRSDPGNYMFQRPENMVFEFGPHPFSVIRLLMGPVVHAECFAAGEQELGGGRRYFESWQISLQCERGTATLYLSIGQGVADTSVRVLGQDAVAHADLVHGTLWVNEPSPRRVAGPLLAGWAHARESLGVAVAGIGHQYGAALGVLASKQRNSFYRSFRAFYDAAAARKEPRESAAAGKAVVEYCEATVGNLKLSTGNREMSADVAKR